MNAKPLGPAILACLVLAACDGGPEDTAPVRHGRYVGVGTYPAGPLWAKMVVANRPRNAASATMADDQQIIVVVDTRTGEIRECGDLTGYCIGMNPWRTPLTPGQAAPVELQVHAAGLANEAEAETTAEPAGNAAR